MILPPPKISIFTPQCTLCNPLVLSVPSKTFYCALWNAVLDLFTSSPISSPCLKSSSLWGRIFLSLRPAQVETGLIYLLWTQRPRDESPYFSFPNECHLRIHATDVCPPSTILQNRSLSLWALPVIPRSCSTTRRCFCRVISVFSWITHTQLWPPNNSLPMISPSEPN